MHLAKPPIAAHSPSHLLLVADAAKPDAAGHGAIGKVTATQGEAFIVRNGERIPATAEAPVFQGDAVETKAGAQISLVFADRETFVLKDKGMMALDEFTFDPVHKTGSATFLIAQGAFTAVSGDLAKTSPDAFHIATPTMVIGVRGTTVSGQVTSEGATSVALLADPGSNFVGEMTLGHLGGGDSIVVNTAGAGIVNATSTSSWTVSPNAAASVAVFAPAAVAPPSVSPPLPAAPATAPGGDHGPAQGQGQQGQGQGGQQHNAAPPPAAEAAPPPPPPAPPPPAPAPPPPEPPPPPPPPPAPPPPAPPSPTPPPPSNTPPTSSPVNLGNATENNPVTITKASLLANAHDANGDTLTVTGLTADHGTFADNGNGTVTFTPAANYVGPVTITYTVDDGHPGGTVTGTASLTEIASVNNAPTITGTVNATAGDHVGGGTTGHVTASDVDANDAGLLAYRIQGGSVLDASHDTLATTHGTVTLNTATGDFTFTPNAGAASLGVGATVTDSFTVAVNDGHGGSVTTTVGVDLTGTNDAPTLGVGNLTTSNDHTLVSSAATSNDPDAGDTVSYHLTGGTVSGSSEYLLTTHGTATIDTVTGGYSFTPNAGAASLGQGQTATDTFDVVATDNHGASSAPGTVSVTINGSNDAPTITTTVNATASDHAGGTTGNVTASDVDANDAGLLAYRLQGGSVFDGTHDTLATTHGTVTIDTTTGDFTFTPNAGAASLGVGATATDSFTVAVNDGHGGSVTTSVGVDITGTNDAPTDSGAVTLTAGTENTPVIITKAALLANAHDVDTGDTLTVTGLTADHGTIADNGDGTVTFTPTNGYVGTVHFTYTVDDGHGGTVAGTATMSENAPLPLNQVGAILHVTSAASLVDANFTGYSGVTTLAFDTATGTQGAVLGSHALAAGITTVDASATTGGVSINASAATQNLTFTGGSGNDIFVGGSGADTIMGGVGADTLTGGGGSDTFVYTNPNQTLDPGASRDVITDFQTGVDHLKISLSGTHVDVSTFAANAGFYNGGQGTLAGGNVVGDGFYASSDQAFYIYVTGTTTDIGADGGYVIGSANQINASDLQFVITGTGNNATLIGGSGDEHFLVSTANLASDSIDGGTGSSYVVLTDAGTLTDTAFANVHNMTGGLVVHDGDVVTLGTDWQNSNMSVIDATATTGAVTVDASATTSYAQFNAGSGTDVFIGGNNVGAVNNFDVSTAALANDTFTGGAGFNSLNLLSGGTVADSAFAHVTNMPNLQLFDGDSVTLGSFSQAAGIVNASASGSTGTEVIDASARTDVVTLQAGSGVDTLIAGTGADQLYGDFNSIGATTFVPTAAGATVSINNYLPSTSNIELDDSKFHLGTSGTLAATNYASDASVVNTISGATHDFNAGVHAAGVVAIGDGGSGATLWYTADMAAATTANSHEFAHVTNVNTTALDNTQFHLHV